MTADKKRSLITGASGMLGRALLLNYQSKYECIALNRQAGLESAEIEWIIGDLTNETFTRKAVNDLNPDVIIHCAAMVNVDACEKNIEDANALHVDATERIVKESRKAGSYVIYISTDSVFDGRKKGAYTEDDVPNPLNVYARTKLEGEVAVLSMEKGLVLRTNIFGWTNEGRSFAEWVIEGLRNHKTMTMFKDVFYSPISTFGLSEIIDLCIRKGLNGLFHAGGKDILSKYDFAIKVAEIYDLATDNVEAVSQSDVQLSAPRPGNMSLDSSRLSNALGVIMPDIRSSISVWRKFENTGKGYNGQHQTQ